jgi:hypothetical protein
MTSNSARARSARWLPRPKDYGEASSNVLWAWSRMASSFSVEPCDRARASRPLTSTSPSRASASIPTETSRMPFGEVRFVETGLSDSQVLEVVFRAEARWRLRSPVRLLAFCAGWLPALLWGVCFCAT